MTAENQRGAMCVDTLLTSLTNANDVAHEIRRLRKVEAWALGTLHLSEGDPAVIGAYINASGGWSPYREVLVMGCTGIAHGFYLSDDGEWSCLFTPDDCWTVSDYPPGAVTRHRKDPAGSFMLKLAKLRRRTDSDKQLPVPLDLRDRAGAR
jgi:hypothetical protein